MGRRKMKDRIAEWRAIDERRARERGDRFSLSWSVDGRGYGPVYEATLASAEARRDKMIAENEKPIPMDYYERQARVAMLEVSIAEYADGAWRRVSGSERRCVWEVQYADGRPATAL